MDQVRSRTRSPRGSGARLREDIVTAAKALIVESGTGSSVTLRAVARQVGISAPSVYLHFDSPEAVVQAVIEEVFEELRDHVECARASVSTPREGLVAGCRAYLAFGAAHPALYGLIFGPRRSSASFRAGAQAHLSLETIEGAGAFAVLLKGVTECIDDGSSTATSPLEAAVQIWVALHGLVQLRANEPSFPWPDPEQLELELITRLGRLHD